MVKPSEQKKIFVAYSKKDRKLLDELMTHLSVLERSGKADVWFDGEIEAGMDWEKAKKEALGSAEVILLIISADFINSEFYNSEIQETLQRNERKEARVIPIIMRDCAWRLTKLTNLEVLPFDKKPIADDELQVSDSAMKEVVEKIFNIIHPGSKITNTDETEEDTVNKTIQKTISTTGTNATENGKTIKKIGFWVVGILLLIIVGFGISQLKNSSSKQAKIGNKERQEIPADKNSNENEEISSTDVSGEPLRDAEGKLNSVVKVGRNTWMGKNLQKASSGSICYKNDPDNCQRSGMLYKIEDAKKACPEGWRLPTHEEWRELLNSENKGMIQESKNSFGGMLRGTPKSFRDGGEVAYFWSGNQISPDQYWVYKFYRSGKKPERFKEDQFRGNAYSCRCVKI